MRKNSKTPAKTSKKQQSSRLAAPLYLHRSRTGKMPVRFCAYSNEIMILSGQAPYISDFLLVFQLDEWGFFLDNGTRPNHSRDRRRMQGILHIQISPLADAHIRRAAPRPI